MGEGGILGSKLDIYLCEFIGTALLVLSVVCAVNGGSEYAAVGIAMTLMVLVYSMGPISGGHFNPAVTLGVMLSHKMEGGWERGLAYMITQFFGGALGAVTGFLIYSKAFVVKPDQKFDVSHAGAVEFIYTTLLVTVVLNCCCCKDRPPNQFFGLAIGFVIIAGGYAAGPISGGALNPAVAFGVDLAGTLEHSFGYSAWYMLFQFLGSLMAALLFRLVRTKQFPNSWYPAHYDKYFAELIGTFYLVITVGLNVLAGNGLAAFSIASVLMCMIYSYGDVSGGHFNPAVTVSILIARRNSNNKLDDSTGLVYILMQILGGVIAGLVYVAIWGTAFALGPGEGFGWGSVSGAEIVFTALLCFTVLSVACIKDPSKDMYGLAIGSCVTVGGFAVGAVSGASLNPAVSLGLDVAHSVVTKACWQSGIAYVGLELVGAGVACLAFYICRPSEFEKAKEQD